MRFDVDAAMRHHEKRQEDARAGAAFESMVDLALERRALAAMMCDDAIGGFDHDADHRESALVLCDGVELDDFADYRHRAAFAALRNLEARGLPSMPWDIVDEISRTDKRNESHVGETVDLAFLASVIIASPRGSLAGLTYARMRLRELAQHRRLA
jgi:hypothetical protein